MKTYTMAHVALALMWLGGVPSMSRAAETTPEGFLWLDRDRIDELVRDRGFHSDDVVRIWRDQAGQRLFLQIRTTNDDTVIRTFSGRGSEIGTVRRGYPVLAESDRVVCTHVDRTLVFASGPVIALSPVSRFGFSPDGTFFYFVHEFATGATLFRSASPLEPLLELPRDLYPQSIFTRTNEIYVFGQRFKNSQPPGTAMGLVYSVTGSAIEFKREIDLSRFGGVEDMDARTDSLLVLGKRDKFNTWGVLSMGTGEFKPLGPVRGRGFFLSRELCAYLASRWMEKASK
jgi:hypothetical protein